MHPPSPHRLLLTTPPTNSLNALPLNCPQILHSRSVAVSAANDLDDHNGGVPAAEGDSG